MKASWSQCRNVLKKLISCEVFLLGYFSLSSDITTAQLQECWPAASLQHAAWIHWRTAQCGTLSVVSEPNYWMSLLLRV